MELGFMNIKITAKDKIKEFMRAEAIKPESAFKMPTMRELTKRFEVSLVTVTRAVKELEAEKVIVCRHGSGIVAARGACAEISVPHQEVHGENGSVVLAVVDYPSDAIWNREYITGQYARQKGYRVINCKIHQDSTAAEVIDVVARQKDCKGLLLMIGGQKLSRIELEAYGKLKIPVVLINSLYDYEQLPANVFLVLANAGAAGELVAGYLYEKGHRRIGLIRNEAATDYSEAYVQSAGRLLKQSKAQLHYFPSIIRDWSNSAEEARRITGENIRKIRELQITALIYLSCFGAFASLPVLKKAGFRLPEDISIIGSTDSWYCQYADPAITATAADYQHMCLEAVDIIAEPEKRHPNKIMVGELLTERKSVYNLKEQQWKS